MTTAPLLPLVCLFALLLPTPLIAQPEPAGVGEWLRNMVDAVHSLNYRGSFVYLHGTQLESMQVIHTVGESGEQERLVSMNGVAREVIRDNASVTCIAPDVKSVSIGNRMGGGGFRAVYSMDTNALSAYYRFHILGDSRVANRQVKVVAIQPMDEFRYGYRLYLDKENRLPLKTDMLDAAGESISQVMFTSLEVDPVIDEMSDSTTAGMENYTWEQQRPIRPTANQSERGWLFADLPEGFQVTLHTRRPSRLADDYIEHFLLSDGLASLSVYVERADGDDLQGATRIGAINAYGFQVDERQVTAVGEVPAATVQRVATSIRTITER